jgi:hypothetical protein
MLARLVTLTSILSHRERKKNRAFTPGTGRAPLLPLLIGEGLGEAASEASSYCTTRFPHFPALEANPEAPARFPCPYEHQGGSRDIGAPS